MSLSKRFGMKEGGVRVEGRWTVEVGLFIAFSLDQQTAKGGELLVGERGGYLSSFSSSFHPPNKHVCAFTSPHLSSPGVN